MAQDPLFTQAISVDFNKFVEKSMKLVKERGKERAPSDFRVICNQHAASGTAQHSTQH